MAQIFILLLMVYAAAGLVLSLVVHILAIAGFQPGGQALFMALHIGIFPLWIPVVLIAMKLTGPMQWGWSYRSRRAALNAMFSGCPAWMKYMTYGFLGYALVNFLIFIIRVHGVQPSGSAPPPAVWHGFSGHWMAFYSAGLAVLTTAYNRGLNNLSPKCPNGHAVGIGDNFCPTCGVKVTSQV